MTATSPVFAPMRPISGGRFDLATPRRQGYAFEEKGNGFRTLVNTETREVYNRTLTRLSIGGLVKPLIGDLPNHEWIDCEFLERRGTGRGILIVIDVPIRGVPYAERRKLFDNLPYIPHTNGDIPKGVYRFRSMTYNEALEFWTKWDVKSINGVLFEGLVAKKLDSNYIIQNNPSRESTDWIKHRFANS